MKKSFTLIELLTVIVIVGIGMALFYSVLFMNWIALEKQLSLVDLQMEADKIVDMLSSEGRAAKDIGVEEEGKNAVFIFPDDTNITHKITSNNDPKKPGELQKINGGNTIMISEYISAEDSSFKKEGGLLLINLVLKDDVFDREIKVAVSTQVYPRNI